MLPDLLKDPESEAITRHRRRRPAFDIQSEGIATIRMTMNVHTDLLMSPSPSAIAVQRFLERCQRCRPDCVTIEIMRPKNLISCPKFVDYCKVGQFYLTINSPKPFLPAFETSLSASPSNLFLISFVSSSSASFNRIESEPSPATSAQPRHVNTSPW